MRQAPTLATPARAAAGGDDLIPGTRYRVLEKLGEGGMGAVYSAEHVDIERRVAIKIVHADLVRNPVVLRQFRQEARAASKIGNPYICDVTDFGELPDGRVFFVMEYLDGPSLAKVLREQGYLLPARTIPILRQVAKALGSAHEKSIVHLDVKPDNVLLLVRHGRDDTVKVVDFGVAGILGQSGGAARVMGTPEYMAPERATGKGYDHRSDIYSLGIMAYEMLVGRVPFQGSTPIETLAMQTADPAEPLSKRLVEPIPAALEAAIMAMLAKDPAERPQSMAEVEALLLEAQIDARLRSSWDDLPLPEVEPERQARIARLLQRPTRLMRRFALGAATAAVVSAATALYLAFRSPTVMVREPPAAAGRSPTVVLATPPPAPPVAAPLPPPAVAESQTAVRGRREGTTEARRREDRDLVAAREAVARGTAALTAGRIEQAKSEFEKAVAADPRNATAVSGLAEVAFERARYDEAVFFATRATRLSSRSLKYALLLGDACFKLGRYGDALKAYERAQALAPDDPAAEAGLARVTSKLGRR